MRFLKSIFQNAIYRGLTLEYSILSKVETLNLRHESCHMTKCKALTLDVIDFQKDLFKKVQAKALENTYIYI